MADEQQPPKKKSKLKWIILIFLFLILGGAGFAGWKFGLVEKFMGGESSNSTAPAAQPAGDGGARAPAFNGLIVPLRTYTTNLADPLGRRILRISLSAQVTDEQAGRELQAQDARVSDTVLMLLSSKSYADIAAPESKEILKSEILSRLNLLLGGPKVTQVLITDFFVQ